MRSAILSLSILLFIAILVPLSTAEILLMEDFEDEASYTDKWIPTAGWSLVEDEIAGEQTTVLDVLGGEIGLSVKDDFGDFELEADFRVVDGYLGFIVRAQDADNLYMMQMTTAESAVTPGNLRWHTRVAGTWAALPEPYLFDIHVDIWYHIRIEVIDDSIKVYVADAEDGRDALELIAEEWVPPSGDFQSGAIGFRDTGSENGRVDNVIVATPGGIEEWLAVQPQSKLSALWGMIKTFEK